ncbi:tyrosine-type recombinase/integrase [Tissierella praeacuta]|uniref:tyrosine-type recombinase/integrase n=1 Tax=Tissierella praeacuta TaxID=43131 RepID=UPI003C7D8595
MEIEALKKQRLEVKNNFIFTGINGGFISKKTISDWFRRFLIRNKLKRITFHGLRHTSATILLASGIPLKNVCRTIRTFSCIYNGKYLCSCYSKN